MLLPWYHETGNALVGKSLQSIDDSKSAFGVYSFVEAAIFVVVAGRARPAVGAGRAQGLPPARRRRHRDHGRRAVGDVPDLLPPARQAQRPPRGADPDLDRRRLGHLHRLPARRAAGLRRLPHPRRPRPRAGGRRRAAPAGRDGPGAGRGRPAARGARDASPPSSRAAGARRPTTSSTASCPSTSPPSTARRRASSTRWPADGAAPRPLASAPRRPHAHRGRAAQRRTRG